MPPISPICMCAPHIPGTTCPAAVLSPAMQPTNQARQGANYHDECVFTVAAMRRSICDKLRPMHDRPLEYRPHPWHGVDPGKRFPEIVRAYIEIVPTDGVKYEIDKHSGYLMVDRPQRFSSFCPTLYGFVPRTYCG